MLRPLDEGESLANDKVKDASLVCEAFWQWKHTSLNYDLSEDRSVDYDETPVFADFLQAAIRTAWYCDEVSSRPQALHNPSRRIQCIRFQSNDGWFKVMFDPESNVIDPGRRRDDPSSPRARPRGG